MSTIQIYDAAKNEQEDIGFGIVEHNNSQVPFTQEPTFVAINRCIKEGDEVIGGIMAEVYCWNILHIDLLWVKDEHRNKGYASALLNDAENTAKEMGCKLSHLDTFDFQAKGLYEKLGYTVFGVLEDCPEGHSRYYMSKKLL
ncbi:MAG: GNAT family N-acetyltransferase [Defluviitaleaceae bacterium]|nr:GNAT family N-acetyltransferase [Defluviitaleaceae bacterium]